MNMYEIVEWYNAKFYHDRTIKIRLKDIFSDHWDNFISENPNLIIRPVIHKEVNRMISCRTSELGYSVYECPNCGEIKFSILVNLDSVLLVVINMLEKGRNQFFKNVTIVNIDILFLLFLIIFGPTLEKTENF